MATTLVCGCSFLMNEQTLKPSIPGRKISNITRSGMNARTLRPASKPSEAVTKSNLSVADFKAVQFETSLHHSGDQTGSRTLGEWSLSRAPSAARDSLASLSAYLYHRLVLEKTSAMVRPLRPPWRHKAHQHALMRYGTDSFFSPPVL